MYKDDKINQCTIYNSAFIDDILPYTLGLNSDDQLSLKFNNNVVSNVDFKINQLRELITQSKNLLGVSDPELLKDVWIPIFITNDNYVQNKEIKRYGTNKKKIFGIEDFISFRGEYKNWIINNANTKLSSDWYTHSNDISYNIDYSIMCWYRLESNNIYSTHVSIKNIPNGYPVVCNQALSYTDNGRSVNISTNDILIKKNDSTLLLPHKDNSIIGSSTEISSSANMTFNSEQSVFNLSKVEDLATLNPLFKVHTETIMGLTTDGQRSNDRLWIADGEAYSYSLNKRRQKEDFSSGICTHTYLSPSLFYKANSIYHRLTATQIKLANGSSLPKDKAKALRKLSYFLATAPTIDRVSLDLLYHPEIQQLLSTFLNTDIAANLTMTTVDINKEITLFAKLLYQIMVRYKNLSSNATFVGSLSSSLVTSKKDLFKRIINKYPAHLRITSDTNVSYKHLMPDGPNFSCRRLWRSFCDKTLRHNNFEDLGPDQTWRLILYNNEKIECQGLELETNFTRNTSEILLDNTGSNAVDAPEQELNNKLLPLADITRSPMAAIYNVGGPGEFGSSPALDLGPPIKITLSDDDMRWDFTQSPPVIVTEKSFFIGGTDLTQNITNYRNRAFWEQVEGPDCLRFSNCAIDPNIRGRCAFTVKQKTTTDEMPKIWIRSTGKYVVRMTMFSPFDTQTDTLTIYVASSAGEYEPGKTVPSEAIDISSRIGEFPANLAVGADSENTIPNDILKTMCCNLSQFALGKQGLFWPLKSDSYAIVPLAPNVIGTTGDFSVPGMVKLQDTGPYFGVKKNNSINNKPLTFTIKPNNTIIYIDNIILEHMRDGSDKYTNCNSLLIDLLYASPTKLGSRPTGTSGYYRRRRGLARTLNRFFARHETPTVAPSGDIIVNFDDPRTSMKFAPPVKAYGGYDQKVVNSLGITIPYHPAPSSTMPVLLTKHNFETPDNILCHKKYLNINSSGDIIFSKGTFHPRLGWIPSPNSQDTALSSLANDSLYQQHKNKNSVLKWKMDKKNTFVFKGLGIYGLKASYYHDKQLAPSYKRSAIYITNRSGVPYSDYTGHDNNLGYRSSSDTYEYMSDEYHVDILNAGLADMTCDITNNAVVYGIDRPDIDSLTIRDIEVRINNLNYPNIKHMVVWLEASNAAWSGINNTTDILDNPNQIDISTVGSQFADLAAYRTALINMNANPDPSTRRLYLLNRDYIEDYTYNYSITFSDNTSLDMGGNPNKINSEVLFKNNQTYTQNHKIKPTLTPNGYDDAACSIYRSSMVKNGLIPKEACLHKFNGLPLKDTTFALYVGIWDYEDNFIVRDMNPWNATLLGMKGVTDKVKPGILSNALCSWDLIIHTDKTTRSEPTDPIGLFDRKNQDPTFTNGSSFIANFKDRKHLIPQVNLNAPYNYLDNSNFCAYKEPELTTATRFNMVEFPTWAILQIITAMTPVYGGGGSVFTGDPSTGYGAIYDFFAQNRASNLTEIQQRKTQVGRYSRRPFGASDKALVAISNDGNVWYKTELPIFRYDNCYTLQNNQYSYIKLKKNNIPFLSHFDFQFFAESDAEFLPSASDWADSLFKHKYIVDNAVVGFSGGFTSTDLIGNKSVIKIYGPRAYYLFDTNDTISISSPTTTDANRMVNRTIASKALISINNKEYTVFKLNTNINDASYFTKPEDNQDTLIIFKNDYTTIGAATPINIWGLEKSQIPRKTPDRHFSAFGEGSYGRGVENIRENTLSYLSNQNHIEPIYENINHKHKFLFRFDSIKVNNLDINLENITSPTRNNTIRGFPWSIDTEQRGLLKQYVLLGKPSPQLLQQIDNLKKQKETARKNITDEDALKARLHAIDASIPVSQVETMFIPDLKEYISFLEPDLQDCDPCLKDSAEKLLKIKEEQIAPFYKFNTSYAFIDLRLDRFKNSSEVPDTGTISIANDFIFNQPQNKLDANTINTINTRIAFLTTKSQAFENRLNIAKEEDSFPTNITLTELKALSIPDLGSYLALLSSEDEPTSCLTPNYVEEDCRIGFTSRLIQKRHEELQTLTRLRDTNNLYTEGILPVIQRSVKTGADGELTEQISYNTDYFWVHIDPDQKCSLATDMTTKIMKEVKYNCIPNSANINGVGILGKENQQVCPETASITGGDEDVSSEGSGKTIYSLTGGRSRDLAAAPGVSSWQEIQIGSTDITFTERYMWLNGGEGDSSHLDTLVAIFEKYDIPSNARKPRTEVRLGDVIDVNNADNIKIRFIRIPRKYKEYDQHYDRYQPNWLGQLGKTTPGRGLGGETQWGFDCWVCLDKNTGRYVNPPDGYKMQNEMIYRAFFGSVDGVENKNSIMTETKEPWEWIPYEYDATDPPQAPASPPANG